MYNNATSYVDRAAVARSQVETRACLQKAYEFSRTDIYEEVRAFGHIKHPTNEIARAARMAGAEQLPKQLADWTDKDSERWRGEHPAAVHTIETLRRLYVDA